MCILIYKPKGVSMPPEEEIDACWMSNPDGAGIAYSDGVGVTIRKGFMTVESLKNYLKAADLTNRSAIIHFRFTTHGSTSPGNCHPFPVSSDIRTLKREKIRVKGYVLAHNGVISDGRCNRKTKADLSDTMMLSKLIASSGLEHAKKEIMKTGHNGKFIIMEPKKITMIGDFIQDNGRFYSNTSYKTPKYYKTYFEIGNEYDWCKYPDICERNQFCNKHLCKLSAMTRRERKTCEMWSRWTIDYLQTR